MGDLPDPLTPAECDLRNFGFMPIDIARLFGSRFHAIASDGEWRAGVTLWLKSFHQVPAGSLPTEDIELARLAEFGRDLAGWMTVRENALYGWVQCADGRLYHPIVAEKALEAWRKKEAFRERSRKANERRWAQQRGGDEAAAQAGRQDHGGPSAGERRENVEGQGVDPEHPSGCAVGSIKDSNKDKVSNPYRSQGTGTGTGTGTIPSGEAAAAAPAKPRSTRGTRLPEDWTLPAEWLTWAAEDRRWPERRVRGEADKFADYWRGRAGKDAVKADWLATWRNWCRRADEGPSGSAPRSPTGANLPGNCTPIGSPC